MVAQLNVYRFWGRDTKYIAGDKEVSKVVTGSRYIRVVREQRLHALRWMLECVHVSNYQIQNSITMGGIVYQLTELGGEEKNVIRFVTVEVTKENEFGFRKFRFE